MSGGKNELQGKFDAIHAQVLNLRKGIAETGAERLVIALQDRERELNRVSRLLRVVDMIQKQAQGAK